MASPMMFEEVHTFRHSWITQITHFLAKLDARKSAGSNRGAIQPLQDI